MLLLIKSRSALEADQQNESTYIGLGFLVVLAGLEKGGFAGGPVTGFESSAGSGWFEVA